VALIDVNVPAQPADRQLLDFLSAADHEFVLVATKSDRLSNNQLHNALRILTGEYPVAHLVPFSAKTGAGRDELWNHIRQVARRSSMAASSGAAQD